MTRWKASLIHLLISLAIVGSIAAYILYFWYPPALLHMAKADKLLGLVGGIDLVVGPLLTLLVYKHGKASLRMDLTVVALIQAAFLSLGLYTLYQSRPVFLVASSRSFDLVFANEVVPEALARAHDPQFMTLGIGKPKLVGAILPTDKKERDRLTSIALAGGGDIQMMPEYYVDFSAVVPDIIAHALPLKPGKEASAAAISVMLDAAKAYGRNPADLGFVQMASSRGFAAMLVDAKTGQIVGPVNVDP